MEIELRGVSKRFGTVQALPPTSLRLEPGELLVIHGANGSGKTTLLRILATALAPDEGEYLWNGQPLRASLAAARQRIGFLGERVALYDDLNLEENLRFWAKVYSADWRSVQNGILQEAVDAWQLGPYSARPMRALSQGTQRRAGLARITVQNPDLILLDEPFNGLDEENSAALLNALRRWQQAGKAIALSTHLISRIPDSIPHQKLELSLRGAPGVLTRGDEAIREASRGAEGAVVIPSRSPRPFGARDDTPCKIASALRGSQ